MTVTRASARRMRSTREDSPAIQGVGSDRSSPSRSAGGEEIILRDWEGSLIMSACYLYRQSQPARNGNGQLAVEPLHLASSSALAPETVLLLPTRSDL